MGICLRDKRRLGMSNWKSELDDLFKKKEEEKKISEERDIKGKEEIALFTSEVVEPAFNELKRELVKHGREVQISSSTDGATMSVSLNGKLEVGYIVSARIWPDGVFVYPKQRFVDKDGKTYISEGGGFGVVNGQSIIGNVTARDIIKDFLEDYKIHISRQ
jgi:hypothetical protein